MRLPQNHQFWVDAIKALQGTVAETRAALLNTYTYIHTYRGTYIHTCIYMYLFVFLFFCLSNAEGVREQRKRKSMNRFSQIQEASERCEYEHQWAVLSQRHDASERTQTYIQDKQISTLCIVVAHLRQADNNTKCEYIVFAQRRKGKYNLKKQQPLRESLLRSRKHLESLGAP